MGKPKRLYRIYYNTYSDDKHRMVIEELKKRFSCEVIDVKSTVLPEFRFLEVIYEADNKSREIEEIVRRIVGTRWVRVDRIKIE